MELSLKITINAILILITVVAGFFLHRTGKPYNNIIFTIHKFTTIGFVVYLSLMIFSFAKNNVFETFSTTFLSISILSIIALLVSGVLLSLDKFYDSMLLIHRISTGSFIVFTCIFFYSIYF